MGFPAVTTNAYIMRQKYTRKTRGMKVHHLIDFPGMVMTDSGGYQVLRYGNLDVGVSEMAQFQEAVKSDIAVVLDRPTGFNVTREYAQETVQATLEACKETLRTIRNEDTIWVGPIQGGRYTDLVEYSAHETTALGYKMLALGSPTEVMENYRFDVLVKMIASVRRATPASVPLHLFGAGHPLALALAVALGCDTFDSASYILFAKERRYMSRNLTLHLDKMQYLPCSCPVCNRHSVSDLKQMPRRQLEVKLAEHNLHVLRSEILAIKESIAEGRLWDHLSDMAYSHPRLRQGFLMLQSYPELIDEGTAVCKSHGLFITSESDLSRPEAKLVTRRLERMSASSTKVLVLVPSESKRLDSRKVKKLLARLRYDDVEIRYPSLLGLVPLELSQLYPFSQLEGALKVTAATTYEQVVELLGKRPDRRVVLAGWPSKSDFADELQEKLERRRIDLIRMDLD